MVLTVNKFTPMLVFSQRFCDTAYSYASGGIRQKNSQRYRSEA
jgi:hypothetical protein